MRVGILTLHSQMNYGGVLQCLALQTVLRDMGHDVVVVDRWMHPHREGLDGVFAKGIGWKSKLRGFLMLLWPRFAMRQIRLLRTRKFITKNLNLTDYHFCDWNDAPRDLGVDVIIVGSDQVWHGGDFGDPQVYLLENAPLKRPTGQGIKAIAYAASFGMPEIPSSDITLYKQGLARFVAISVREDSGREMLEALGCRAVTVLDPTLLLSQDTWRGFVCGSEISGKQGNVVRKKLHLVCYLLNQDIEEILPLLEKFGRRNNCKVSVVMAQLKPHLTSMRACRSYLFSLLGGYPHVRLWFSAGPGEFLRVFADADYCITDSFHALMFSSIFNVNCRVLSPQMSVRQRQFSRIQDFLKFVDGPLIVQDVSSAIASIESGNKVTYQMSEIRASVANSKSWLNEVLGAMQDDGMK